MSGAAASGGAPGSAGGAGRDALAAVLAAAGACGTRGVRLVDRREQERWLSWSELVQRAGETGGALQVLGVAPGATVALCLPSGEEVLVALLATWLAGAVPVVVPPPLRLGHAGEQRRRVGAALLRSQAVLLLADAALVPALREVAAAAALPFGCRALDELAAASLAPVALGDGALGLVQLSSGSTGEPKPVALARDALVGQARLLNALWPDRDGWRASGASWLPLHHDMGLVGCLLPALERRTDLTLLAPEAFVVRPALWLRAIARAGATVSPAPTFGYAHCLRRVRDEELASVDLSTWRHALCGAEPVVPEVLRGFATRFARWGFRSEALTPVYGLAEAGLAVTFAALDRPFASARFDREALRRGSAVTSAEGRELVSLGSPLPGFALQVRDGAGTALPEGQVGRLWLRGPTLMAGYLGDPRATTEALRDGWLDSGDLGFLAGDELFLVGRAKDVVIVRGSNLAAEEIEAAALAGDPGLRPGAVAAVGHLPEASAGDGEQELTREEELVLLVEREAGSATPAVQLAAHCREGVLRALGVRAARVVVVAAGALPRTSSGKLRRGDALRAWREGELSGEELAADAAAASRRR